MDSAERGALASLVARVARVEPARPALLAPGREPLAYGALNELLGSVTESLRVRGIGPDGRVALVVQNGPEAATAFLALASAATCAPLNPSYRREELGFYLDDLKAAAVVVSRGLDSPVRQVASDRGIPVLELDAATGEPAGVFGLDGPAGRRSAAPPHPAGEVALLLHTSGTTSRPKLVPLTQRNLAASARHISESLALRPADRCLNLMPLFHIHGLAAALLASLAAGGSVVCSPGFHALRAFDWLGDFEPTWITAVPTMHQSLLARCADRRDVVRNHRLRFVRSSSAALPVTVSEQLEWTFGVPVVEAYGMTEAAHQMASNPLPPGRREPGSVGPAAGPEICILSAGGEPLPAGAVGEVAIRGPNVFAGYEDNPEANGAAFVDGWFRTGDEGSLDDDGYLWLSGRIKEQINRGGEKVPPLEIDQRLLAHPAVAEAVCFGVPDARLGEEVAAAVVLEAGAATSESALQDFVAETLAPFKVPRRILVVDKIPKGPTGKLQRIGLADRLGVAHVHPEPAEHVAPRTALESQLALIWADVLGLPSVGLHDDFFALGGDSILGAEAVARVRELSGVEELPLISIVRAPTVGGMVRELDRGVSALAASGPIALNPEASGTPFFLVHGGDGEVLEFAALARALGTDCPLYGIRARGIDDGAEPLTSIEAMAAAYVEAVRSVQEHGPYALGGYCLGGTVALEMAHRLEAAGETVSALVLVDLRLPRPKDLRYHLWLAPRRLRQGTLLRALLRRIPPRGPRWDPGQLGRSRAEQTISRAREAYEPRRYDRPTVLILSDGHGRHDIPIWHLRRVVPNAGLIRIHSTHTMIIRPPAVHILAREIRAALGLRDRPQA